MGFFPASNQIYIDDDIEGFYLVCEAPDGQHRPLPVNGQYFPPMCPTIAHS